MRSIALTVVVLSNLAAAQVPAKLAYQGRLLRPDGTPEDGIVKMTFAIFAEAAGGAALWTEEKDLALTSGYYVTMLGDVTAFPAGLFDGTERFLEVTLPSGPLSPRQRTASVPYALMATEVKGGRVDASSVKVNGKEIIDSTGKWVGAKSPGGVVALDLRFEETTGTTFADSSGYGNTAVAPLGGLAIGSAGHSGKAVNFSGGVVNIAAPNSIPDSAQVWVEAWVQPQLPVNVTRTILTKVGAYSLRQVNQNLSFGVFGTAAPQTACTATSSGSMIIPGNWTHVAAWYDGLQVTVAINGVVRGIASCPNGALVATPEGAFTVGGILNGTTVTQPYAGLIDDVRVRTVAARNYSRERAYYTQWGTSSCTGAGAETLSAGFGFANHYQHPANGAPLCLMKGDPSGVTATYGGDILYGVSVEGGAVHQGAIVNSTRLACSQCAIPGMNSCFELAGSTTCPADYTAMYTGYLYGGHYTHGRMGHVCIDSVNYDASTTTGGADNASYVYPSGTWATGGTGVTVYRYVKCAICCTN